MVVVKGSVLPFMSFMTVKQTRIFLLNETGNQVTQLDPRDGTYLQTDLPNLHITYLGANNLTRDTLASWRSQI